MPRYDYAHTFRGDVEWCIAECNVPPAAQHIMWELVEEITRLRAQDDSPYLNSVSPSDGPQESSQP